MPDQHAGPPPDDDAGFFEEFLREAAGPYILDLDGEKIVIEAPSGDDVCALDTATTPTEQLDALVGEDLADDILDVYEDRPASELIDLVDDIRLHFGALVPPLGGFLRVVETLDLYGEDIERDLIDVHLNLYDWVRDHLNTPWAKLFRFLDRPIEGGWYTAAVATDVDLAARLLQLEEDGKAPPRSKRPSMVGWDRNRETLTAILETLQQIAAGQYDTSLKVKRRVKPPRPQPRPLTARERVKQYRLYVEHDEIASQMLGSRYKRLTLPDPTD